MKKIYLFFMLFVCAAHTMHARVRTIQTDREFHQQLRTARLLVALFYNAQDKLQQERLRTLFGMYETVSSRKLFDDADTVFVKINVSNSSLRTLEKQYTITEHPCFMLFHEGKPVVDGRGRVAQLTGNVAENDLQAFIKRYFNKIINNVVTKKEYQRQERVIKSQEEWDPYFYPAVVYAPEYDFSWQKPLKYDAQGNEK